MLTDLLTNHPVLFPSAVVLFLIAFAGLLLRFLPLMGGRNSVESFYETDKRSGNVIEESPFSDMVTYSEWDASLCMSMYEILKDYPDMRKEVRV